MSRKMIPAFTFLRAYLLLVQMRLSVDAINSCLDNLAFIRMCPCMTKEYFMTINLRSWLIDNFDYTNWLIS